MEVHQYYLQKHLGSIGGALAVDDNHTIVGLEINANHIGGVSDGNVVGIARPIHMGKTTQFGKYE